jgi:hypothetical protein
MEMDDRRPVLGRIPWLVPPQVGSRPCLFVAVKHATQK